ncbi:hypothetical protein [Mucilaginibacter corticis]|uniref:hypothetical protein n=1 Tax=Mucilaginibacter corticis TaxID=2597670 RepID=UPI001642D410|nr:hypothetical protein [Mucilaginibacter corticis]
MTTVQLIIETNALQCELKILAASFDGFTIKSFTSSISMDATESFIAVMVKHSI